MSAGFQRCVLAVLMCGLAASAHADIYAAEAAYQKKDFGRAFELFREIAELGNPLAQETLAIMYVQGEGVPRNNALGYAWALLAKENGLGTNVQPIIDQVGPRLSPEAMKSVEEVRAKFGKAALEERLIPARFISGADVAADPPKRQGCTIKRPANPDDFYPREAVAQGVSGLVQLRVPIHTDGRARNPQVEFAIPPTSFDAAARKLAHANNYVPLMENGAAAPCVIRFRVRFTMHESDFTKLRNEVARLEKSANAGDPLSQFQYAMLKTGWKELNPEDTDYTHMTLKAAQAGLVAAQYVIGVGAVESAIPGNPEKGLAWLKMSAAAGSRDAQVALAQDILRRNPGVEDAAHARELLEKAVASGSEQGSFYLADVLNGEVDAARRDPARVAKLIDDAFVIREHDPAIMEIRAAALSQLGDFDTARRFQASALRIARRLGWDVAEMQGRLDQYEKGQPWVGRLLVY